MNTKMFIKVRGLSFVVLTITATSCISLIGGLGLEAVQERILPLVPLIIAIPALNTLSADYGAIIAAHASDSTENKRSRLKLAVAISRAIWVNIFGILALSILLAFKRGYVFEQIFITKFLLFVVASILIVIFAMFLISYFLELILRNNKLNPDDVLIPIVTSLTDIIMLSLIALGAMFIF